jgi:hypothetical protein
VQATTHEGSENEYMALKSAGVAGRRAREKCRDLKNVASHGAFRSDEILRGHCELKLKIVFYQWRTLPAVLDARQRLEIKVVGRGKKQPTRKPNLAALLCMEGN